MTSRQETRTADGGFVLNDPTGWTKCDGVAPAIADGTPIDIIFSDGHRRQDGDPMTDMLLWDAQRPEWRPAYWRLAVTT